MGQLTVRAPDDLVARVRLAATAAGQSINEYVVAVLGAATDPNLAGSQAERIRQRLAQAGLLEVLPSEEEPRPSPEALRLAGRRAASGRSLAELVHEGR
ncbi:MAG: toxin-antitoxin system HicB family antitoxin [Acidimicrobiales bacterium]